MIARPTATSAAATTKMNTTNTLPRSSIDANLRENATRARFVALSISSTDMRITTALRRTRTPAVPMKNRTAETAMNAPSGTATLFLVPLHEHDGPDHRREQEDRRDFKGKREVAEDARRERNEITAARARGRRVAELERHQRDEDRDRNDEERGPELLRLEEEPVRARRLRREHDAVQDEDGDGAHVDEHLEHGDGLGAEQHEHPGDVEERECHEQRGGRDPVGEHDANACPDGADGQKGEERGPEDVQLGRGRPKPLAERDQPTALEVRKREDEDGEEDPVRDRHRHERGRECQQQDRGDHEVGERQRDQDFPAEGHELVDAESRDRKSTRLNSSHLVISYAVFCLKKKIV